MVEKTTPVEAPAFPQRALLRAQEFRVRNAKLKQAQLEQRRAWRKSRASAVQLLASQVPNCEDHDVEDIAATPMQTPHPSHYISAVAGEGNALWCKACACWSLKARLRGLANVCRGMGAGNNSTLRLLQCGVLPIKGARLPPGSTIVRRRKGRW